MRNVAFEIYQKLWRNFRVEDFSRKKKSQIKKQIIKSKNNVDIWAFVKFWWHFHHCIFTLEKMNWSIFTPKRSYFLACRKLQRANKISTRISFDRNLSFEITPFDTKCHNLIIEKDSFVSFYCLDEISGGKKTRWNFYAQWISMLNVLRNFLRLEKLGNVQIYHALQKVHIHRYFFSFISATLFFPSQLWEKKTKKLLTRFTIIYTLHVCYIVK